MKEISLGDCGLETVADACARKGWAAKTLQNWIARDLIGVIKIGRGRGTYLLRIADVDALVPPVREDGRGRPLAVRAKVPVFVPEASAGVTAAPPARSNSRRRKRSGT